MKVWSSSFTNITNVTHTELDVLKDHPIPNDFKHTNDHHFVSSRNQEERKFHHEDLIDFEHHTPSE